VLSKLPGTIHLEKEIKAPVARVYRAFEQTKALKVWYDPRCRIESFAVGGKLVGDNYPSAEILALIPNHTIVHRYNDIVTGLGIWSFVEKNGGKKTLLIFDHLDAYNSKEDRDSITFYWRGLIDNLAAFCEGREIPFDHDAGNYMQGMRPRALNT
jgi:uncharacterized protein YndB with AHSA1/START domain